MKRYTKTTLEKFIELEELKDEAKKLKHLLKCKEESIEYITENLSEEEKEILSKIDNNRKEQIHFNFLEKETVSKKIDDYLEKARAT